MPPRRHLPPDPYRRPAGVERGLLQPNNAFNELLAPRTLLRPCATAGIRLQNFDESEEKGPAPATGGSGRKTL